MTDKDVHLVSIFFFYAFLDEELAIKALSKAKVLIEKNLKSSQEPKERILISATSRIWNSCRGKINNKKRIEENQFGKEIFKNSSLEGWRSFHQKSNEDDLLSVLWNRVLGFSEENISLCLGVSTGTVRYRVGKGLSLLGEQV